jgi:hypothetical protein
MSTETQKSPSKEWLENYEQKKYLLVPENNLSEYFTSDEIAGKKIHLLNMGTVNFPTGNILVCDPLVFLTKKEGPYFIQVPTGIYPLTAAVVEVGEAHYRYAAVKVQFSDKEVVRFTEALKGNEDLDNINEGAYFGFNVDAGLGTIVDVKTRDAYCDFEEEWRKIHLDDNIYDDFFAEEFKKSYQKQPLYQRDGGDWINFTIPGTELTIPMFQSGFGDGTYPVYFGFDKDDQVCQVIIEFIDIVLNFGEEEEK